VTHCLRLLVSLEARMRRGRRLVLGPLSPRLSLVAPPFVHRPRTVAWAARARLRKEGEGWKQWKQDMSGSTCRKIGPTSTFGLCRRARRQRPGRTRRALERASTAADRGRGDRRLRDDRGGGARRGLVAAGG